MCAGHASAVPFKKKKVRYGRGPTCQSILGLPWHFYKKNCRLSLSLYRNCAVAELSSYSQGSVGTFAAQCPALQLNCTVDLLPIMVRLKLPYAIHLQDPLPPLVATESIASSLFKHLKSEGDSCANISCNPRFATFYTDDIHSRVVNQLTKGMEENYRQTNLFKLPSH